MKIHFKSTWILIILTLLYTISQTLANLLISNLSFVTPWLIFLGLSVKLLFFVIDFSWIKFVLFCSYSKLFFFRDISYFCFVVFTLNYLILILHYLQIYLVFLCVWFWIILFYSIFRFYSFYFDFTLAQIFLSYIITSRLYFCFILILCYSTYFVFAYF